MDFWDLTVLVFRRWKVALPLLLVAVGATTFVALTAKPDYTMTSYVQLIPAKVAPTDDAVNASMRNPWNQLGLATLGQASIYATQDQEFLDSLKASDHTDSFTLTMTYPNPIVTVEVVGVSPSDARDTTELVISRLRSSAEALQKQSGAQDKDIIATQRLDRGQNLVPSGGKVKRALAAVAAAGLLMTVGGTVGFDALARRRSRMREERASTEVPPQEKDAPSSPDATMVRTELTAPTPSKAGEPPEKRAQPAARMSEVSSSLLESPSIIVKRTSKVVKRFTAAQSTRRPQAATYRSVNAQAEVNGDDHDAAPAAANGDAVAAASDVRVVLQPKWLGGESGGKSH